MPPLAAAFQDIQNPVQDSPDIHPAPTPPRRGNQSPPTPHRSNRSGSRLYHTVSDSTRSTYVFSVGSLPRIEQPWLASISYRTGTKIAKGMMQPPGRRRFRMAHTSPRAQNKDTYDRPAGGRGRLESRMVRHPHITTKPTY